MKYSIRGGWIKRGGILLTRTEGRKYTRLVMNKPRPQNPSHRLYVIGAASAAYILATVGNTPRGNPQG